MSFAGAEDFLAIAKSMNETAQPFVRVHIDGVPCAVQGCCSASMLIRPGFDSDSDVLSHDLSWYTGKQLHVLVNTIHSIYKHKREEAYTMPC